MEDPRYTYLKRRREDIQQLQIKLDQKDFNLAKMIGHKLKGHGSTFGYPKISDLGVPMEEAAEKEDIETLKSITQELSALIENGLIEFTQKTA